MKNFSLPPAEMHALKELESLIQGTIDGDKISCFAEQNTLVALSLRYCGLTTLPDSLSQLTNLQFLDLTGNQLVVLPDWIGRFPKLRRLYVDDNRLAFLPESLGELNNLEELHADVNQLVALPVSIGQLTSLRRLYLYDNRLTSVPAEYTDPLCQDSDSARFPCSCVLS